MKKALSIIGIILIASGKLFSQGYYNHTWLLGRYNFLKDPKRRTKCYDTEALSTRKKWQVVLVPGILLFTIFNNWGLIFTGNLSSKILPGAQE